MPFTPAHAAIAPPLHAATRGRLPFAGLAVGAVSPDFPYFLTQTTHARWDGHTLLGLFTLDLPLALLFLALFHGLMKRPLAALAPPGHRHLLIVAHRPLARDARAFGWLCLAILLGAFTHIVWDAFTHRDGWIVERAPLLGALLITFGDFELRVYRALQYASGAGGLLYLAVAYRAWAEDREEPLVFHPLPEPWRRWLSASGVLAAATGATAGWLASRAGGLEPRAVVGAILAGMSAAWLWALVFGAVATAARWPWASRPLEAPR